MPTSNVDVYMENSDRLLRCESEEEFHHEIYSLSSSCFAAYLSCFSKRIKPEMLKYIRGGGY